MAIPVSTATNTWIAAEVLRDAFIHSLQGEEDLPIEDEAHKSSNEPIFVAKFLGFLSRNIDSLSPSHLTVLSSTLEHFTSYLAATNIHTLAISFDSDTRKTFLTNYFAALALLEAQSGDVPRASPSALFEAATQGKAGIYALFGGQSTNEVYFD